MMDFPKDSQDSMTDAQITSDMTALTAATDASVPADVKRMIGTRGDGWEITAATPATRTTFVPATPLPDGEARYQWAMNRVLGKPVFPPAIERVEEGYYIRVMGNAVRLESWLRSQGWHAALAGSPHAVWLGHLCHGTMRLQPGDYRACDQCGYVTEED